MPTNKKRFVCYHCHGKFIIDKMFELSPTRYGRAHKYCYYCISTQKVVDYYNRKPKKV
jgi:hypothetical protein